MGKNLQKVQDMLDGKGTGKIQSGYTPDKVNRKIGDRWTDSDGIEWEQKDGYYSKVSKIERGIFSKQCKDCERNCSINKRDLDTWKRMNRCFYCQIDFETMLKTREIGESNNKWFFWVKLQQLRRWDAIDNEMDQMIDEIHKARKLKDNPFDKSVVNAMANANLEEGKL
tara:strand:+ start:16 stop:522 length:507 start_codon:yes stop_codon:yes gene_type:complete